MPLRRLKLHRSTLVLACLLTLLATILVVPGITVGGGSGGCRAYFETHPEELIAREGFVSTSLHEHGWPWVFLRRQTLADGWTEPLLNLPWMYWSEWKVWDAKCSIELSVTNLLLDLLLTCAMISLASAAWALRRRRRKRLLQLRICDILAITAVISLGLGWFVFQRKASTAEKVHIDALSSGLSGLFMTEMDSSIFNVTNRLFGPQYNFLIPPYRVTHILIEGSRPNNSDSMSFEEAIPHLRAIRSFHHLQLERPADFRLDLLTQIPQLRTLQLDCYSGNPVDLFTAQHLVELQQLAKIVLYEKSELTEDALQLITAEMPNCEIVFAEDNPSEWISWEIE